MILFRNNPPSLPFGRFSTKNVNFRRSRKKSAVIINIDLRIGGEDGRSRKVIERSIILDLRSNQRPTSGDSNDGEKLKR